MSLLADTRYADPRSSGGVKHSWASTFRESGRTALEFYTQIKAIYRGI